MNTDSIFSDSFRRNVLGETPQDWIDASFAELDAMERYVTPPAKNSTPYVPESAVAEAGKRERERIKASIRRLFRHHGPNKVNLAHVLTIVDDPEV